MMMTGIKKKKMIEEEEEGKAWTCPSCTFLNHPAVGECEHVWLWWTCLKDTITLHLFVSFF